MKIRRLALILLPFLLLTFLLLFTNPYDAPLVLVVVPFALIGFGVFELTKFIFGILRVSAGKSRLIAGLMTSTILLTLLLQSIGQLHFKDLLLLTILVAGLSFYLQRVDT